VVVTVGLTLKLAPLAELPILLPPVDTVYQLIVLPAEVAFNCDDEPQLIEEGVAE
jgi:hypothetical protein